MACQNPFTLSIIIPAYNAASTLESCLKSVVGQYHPEVQIILIDDGSTDQTPHMAEQYVSVHPNIEYHRQTHAGLSVARNKGISLAKGSHIGFLDSDDSLSAQTIDHLLQLISIHQEYDLIEFPIHQHYNNPIKQHWLKFSNKTYTDPKTYWLQAKAYRHAYACNKLFKRKLFDQVTFAPGQKFEDVIILPQLLNMCRMIHTTDKGLYLYRDNPSGITHQATSEDLEALLRTHLAIAEHWIDADYYQSMINLQLDLYTLTRKPPIIPELAYRQTLKQQLIHFIGIHNLCKLHLIYDKCLKRQK